MRAVQPESGRACDSFNPGFTGTGAKDQSRLIASRFIVSRLIASRFIVSRFIASRFIVSRFIVSRFIVSRLTQP
jgi:hypothetical protein